MSRRTTILYWTTTVFVALQSVAAGVIDAFHLPPLFSLLGHLGYPAYFGTLLGAWKVLGGIALLAPRQPLLKEWAYAGLFFDFTAAVVSHLAVGDGVTAVVAPLVSLAALALSWSQRPPDRRLALNSQHERSIT